jgi:hypothetical protein
MLFQRLACIAVLLESGECLCEGVTALSEGWVCVLGPLREKVGQRQMNY